MNTDTNTTSLDTAEPIIISLDSLADYARPAARPQSGCTYKPPANFYKMEANPETDFLAIEWLLIDFMSNVEYDADMEKFMANITDENDTMLMELNEFCEYTRIRYREEEQKTILHCQFIHLQKQYAIINHGFHASHDTQKIYRQSPLFNFLPCTIQKLKNLVQTSIAMTEEPNENTERLTAVIKKLQLVSMINGMFYAYARENETIVVTGEDWNRQYEEECLRFQTYMDDPEDMAPEEMPWNGEHDPYFLMVPMSRPVVNSV